MAQETICLAILLGICSQDGEGLVEWEHLSTVLTYNLIFYRIECIRERAASEQENDEDSKPGGWRRRSGYGFCTEWAFVEFYMGGFGPDVCIISRAV